MAGLLCLAVPDRRTVGGIGEVGHHFALHESTVGVGFGASSYGLVGKGDPLRNDGMMI